MLGALQSSTSTATLNDCNETLRHQSYIKHRAHVRPNRIVRPVRTIPKLNINFLRHTEPMSQRQWNGICALGRDSFGINTTRIILKPHRCAADLPRPLCQSIGKASSDATGCVLCRVYVWPHRPLPFIHLYHHQPPYVSRRYVVLAAIPDSVVTSSRPSCAIR